MSSSSLPYFQPCHIISNGTKIIENRKHSLIQSNVMHRRRKKIVRHFLRISTRERKVKTWYVLHAVEACRSLYTTVCVEVTENGVHPFISAGVYAPSAAAASHPPYHLRRQQQDVCGVIFIISLRGVCSSCGRRPASYSRLTEAAVARL